MQQLEVRPSQLELQKREFNSMNKSRIDNRLDILKETQIAEDNIRSHIRETPLEYSKSLSLHSQVYLKMENLQITGSFKLRGALNKVLSLTSEEINRGIITASSGNHGMAFAYITQKFDLKGTIYLPETASPAKLEALRSYGLDLILTGNDCIKAERAARKAAQDQGKTFISPYNDPQVIGGQGTIGIELERQLERIDAVLIPVGGGGLIAGIAGYLKARHPEIQIFGCQPQNSCIMYESLQAGHIIDKESLPTISDGTAGGIELDTLTFAPCQEFVDDFILLSEEEIKSALRLILEKQYVLIEGAAALPVAAFLKRQEEFKDKNIVLVFSGAKISLNTLKSIL